jgi:hypothetical protein
MTLQLHVAVVAPLPTDYCCQQRFSTMQESQATESLSARDFAERELRSNPELSYAEVQSRAERHGLNVPRFLYGSTRRALGLPPHMETESTPADRDVTAGVAAGREPVEDEDAQPSADDRTDPEAAATAGPAGDDEAAPKKSSAFEFAVETLRMSPDISFQDLKARASMAGLKLPPIVYGRAKALLGLVRQVDSASEVERLPTLDGIRSVEQLVATVRTLEAERQRLTAMLRDIQKAVEDALADEPSAGDS